MQVSVTSKITYRSWSYQKVQPSPNIPLPFSPLRAHRLSLTLLDTNLSECDLCVFVYFSSKENKGGYNDRSA